MRHRYLARADDECHPRVHYQMHMQAPGWTRRMTPADSPDSSRFEALWDRRVATWRGRVAARRSSHHDRVRLVRVEFPHLDRALDVLRIHHAVLGQRRDRGMRDPVRVDFEEVEQVRAGVAAAVAV